MSARSLKLALAQGNLLVGDVAGNLSRIEQWCAEAADADLLLTPELALTGYPPEDLLFQHGLRAQVERAIERLLARKGGPAVLLGAPEYFDDRIFNAAYFIAEGKIVARHRKQQLPNYGVFDELRHFREGSSATVVDHRGFRLGILICEDLWFPEPAQAALAAGAEVLLVLNASPYALGKQVEREDIARQRVEETGLPLVYVNLFGGQDEFVFDGQSFAMDASGELVARAPCAEETLLRVELQGDATGVRIVRGEPAQTLAPPLSPEAQIYRVLTTGLRDYVDKHRFPGVLLGLSGGVDSALTLAIAVDALGAERVQAVMMPSRYTATISREDAAEQARRLGVHYSVIPIEGMFEAALAALREEFAGRAPDTTEENLQARCRMLILMGISNKTGRMVLTTGNKSEVAVGYATLYGDMAGGFAPLKDCSKMLVYRLAHHRNGIGEVIPERVLTRAPSAELRAGQTDQDSLPPYEILDAILEALIEENLSCEEIVARGFDQATVLRVLELVQRNEYKRRQSPPGVKVTRRAFGREWRYPLPNGFHQRFFTDGSLRGSEPKLS